MTITIVRKHDAPTTNRRFYCGRGSALGNPYFMKGPDSHFSEDGRDYACDQYEKYFEHCMSIHDKNMLKELKEIYDAALVGDVELACFCAPKRCHTETIKRYIEAQLS